MYFRKGYLVIGAFTISCHHCGNGVTIDAESKSKAILIAKKEGWVFTRAFGWICYGCENPE